MSHDLLEQLIREQAPTPRAEFADSLDRRVEHGFASSAQNAAERDPIWRWEPAVLRALGAFRRSPALALVALIALTVVGGGILTSAMSMKQSGRDAGGGSSGEASTGAVQLRPGDYQPAPIDNEGGYAADTADTDGATYSSGTSSTAVTASVSDFRRHILGSGFFLAVEPKVVPQVVADAVEVARDLDGYPGSSSYDVDGATATGSADLWVPTDRVAEAMARLSRLGDVERTTSESRDVTASRAGLVDQITTDQARLRDLERRSGDDTYSRQTREAIANQLQLRRQRLSDLDRRIDMSLINVKVRGVEPEPEPPSERWTLAWAVDTAGDVLRRTAAITIVAAGSLMLPAVVAAVAWVALRIRHRRMRERVLDDDE